MLTKTKVLGIRWILVCMMIVLMVCPGYASEQEDLGFSGYLLVGGAFSRGSLSLDDASEDDNIRLTSLGQSSTRDSQGSFIVDAELNYGFATGTKIGLNMENGPGIKISQRLNNWGTLSLGANTQDQDVWEDPFLTGVRRSKTDQETIRVTLAWEEIMGTGFSFWHTIECIDIDRDVAGKRDRRLRREGEVHYLSLSHSLFNKGTHDISATLTARIRDLEGKAGSSKGGTVSLSHTLTGNGWDLGTSLSLGIDDYDETHPEFNREREDRQVGIGTAFTVYNPLGFENFFITLFTSYDKRNSNINFYDQSVFSTGAGVGINF